MILGTNYNFSLTAVDNQIVICARIEKECDDCPFLKVFKLVQGGEKIEKDFKE